ncbi:hypothetical protein Hanom_Chr13g01215291 [Helianthus anomalus]
MWGCIVNVNTSSPKLIPVAVCFCLISATSAPSSSSSTILNPNLPSILTIWYVHPSHKLTLIFRFFRTRNHTCFSEL